MIFTNPSGAPELACDECGCRWFDRMTNRCYECGADVPAEHIAEFEEALRQFAETRNTHVKQPPSPPEGEPDPR